MNPLVPWLLFGLWAAGTTLLGVTLAAVAIVEGLWVQGAVELAISLGLFAALCAIGDQLWRRA